MTERVSIQEAAERLGVSADTVRRRLKRGELKGERVKTPQGFVWRIEVTDDAPNLSPPEIPTPIERAAETMADVIEITQLRERVIGLERLADELKSERDAWRDQAARTEDAARELRILLRQAQTLALPPSVEASETRVTANTPQDDSGVPKGGFESLIARIRTRLGLA